MPPDKNIDQRYDSTGTYVKALSEKIWSYHVWCDAWMKRPGLTGQDGWQAVDGTAQEQSDGFYQMGPASHVAIHGNSGGLYDVAFVVSEVDADVRFLHETAAGSGTYTLTETNTTHMGHDITTKAVGANTGVDITTLYKVPETPPAPLLPPSSVQMSVDDIDSVSAPNPISVSVHLENSANQSRTVELTLNTYPQAANGETFDAVSTQLDTVVVQGNSTEDVEFTVETAIYAPSLADTDAFVTHVVAFVDEHNETHIAQSLCNIDLGEVDVIPVSAWVNVGDATTCNATFQNPLLSPLTNARLILSVGHALSVDGALQVETQLGTIGAQQSINVSSSLSGLQLGHHLVSARLMCDQLEGIFGSADFHVTHTSDINLDGQVNIDDLLEVVNSWGPCAGCPADIDGNRVVDIDDLLLVINFWGWHLD